MKRREFLISVAAAAVIGCAMMGRRRAQRYALNPPTVRGYNLSLREQVRLAIAAGFDGLEPWLKDVHAARQAGELRDIIAMARDHNFKFINGIAFGTWVDNDPARRAAGMAETQRDMEALAEMDCPCIAASMFGSHKAGSPQLSREVIAERYAAVCALGQKMGVRPLLEYWGHSVNLCRIDDALWCAEHAHAAGAGVLADVYHTYRGGSNFASFRWLSADVLPVLHMNDYPARPREILSDADRVWPGDGAAPWEQIFAALDAAGAEPWLSIELFNPNYWQSDALTTMRTALAKMKGVRE